MRPGKIDGEARHVRGTMYDFQIRARCAGKLYATHTPARIDAPRVSPASQISDFA